ncbi:MAG TPA: hypothetical protein VHU62_09015, partial [Mycobacterium sp.]|nr:hypothetical protein [Mycobacterium sp.]
MGGRAAGRALGRAALIGPIGLASSYPYTDDVAVVADEAQHVESLGFSTLWRSGNLQRDHPGRFIVGVGGAHGARPVETLNVYLDEWDSAGIVADARVLAVLLMIVPVTDREVARVWSRSRWDFSHRWADTAETC